jgi:hypothetical protein
MGRIDLEAWQARCSRYAVWLRAFSQQSTGMPLTGFLTPVLHSFAHSFVIYRSFSSLPSFVRYRSIAQFLVALRQSFGHFCLFVGAWYRNTTDDSDETVLRTNGLNGYFFLRYLRKTQLILFVGCCLTWPLLFPLNATGGGGQQG